MARPESVAVAGYFPTPAHLIERLAARIAPVVFPPPEKSYDKRIGDVGVCDPCAGDGAAILGVMKSLHLTRGTVDENATVSLYAAELEETRAAALKKNAEWPLQKDCVHADAFRLTFKRAVDSGCSLLFLNPPYDTDREFGRLEERFLRRFTDVLALGGVLVLLIPFSSLAASAETLATHYENVRCWRFPPDDFAAFKQVALYAVKCAPRHEPDAKILTEVKRWAEGGILGDLPKCTKEPHYTLPIQKPYSAALSEWRERVVDVAALLAKHVPWKQTSKGGGLASVHGILPDGDVAEAMARVYPLATPPRPAHIAAGIASGIFNGARIEPKKKGLPSLLIKGVFDREYVTVEEKHNKHGEVTAEVQVQQPKLVTTVLDLSTYRYVTIAAGVEKSGSKSIETMNAADLLEHYGESLMHVMRAQCPVLYDPKRDALSIALAPSPRKLFSAQAHASKAIVKLLGVGNAAVLLGEIGSGKTTVAIVAARSVGAKKLLVVCPPHLLKSWQNEVAAVAPDATSVVFQTIEDLETFEALSRDGAVIGILSREAAKLSHAWAAVEPRFCPRCGAAAPTGDLAKRHARCESKPLRPGDTFSRAAAKLGAVLAGYSDVVPARTRFAAIRQSHAKSGDWRKEKIGKLLDKAIAKLLTYRGEGIDQALVYCLLALGLPPDRVAGASRALLTPPDQSYYSVPDIARSLLLFLPDGDPNLAALPREFPSKNTYATQYDPWNVVPDRRKDLAEGKETSLGYYGARINVERREGVLCVSGVPSGSLRAAEAAEHALRSLGRWVESPVCDEPLYGAVPEPRRVSLARYITKRCPKLFDFLVLDESHEYNSESSAQSISGHRLTNLKLPTILMTGSVMNGYAESLFINMWAVSEDFRKEFDRDESQRFVNRFGYRKRIVEDKDAQGDVVEFGSQSDRVVRSERVIGNAPGVLPLFLLRHLLPVSVTLHKADLALDLPANKLIRFQVKPTEEHKKRYDKLKDALVRQIKHDRYEPEVAGKLFGQLAELPSYLDRATNDVGNDEDGAFRICYPESLESKVVAEQPGFSAKTILEKEAWLLDLLDVELKQGRNVMVFTWHLNLITRLAKLIEARTGEAPAILLADKVPTAKRQDWIDKNVVRPNKRVLLANPVAIQTGLNNLVHFHSQAWMENPACNPTTFRQAMGRIDRIGQTKETRVFFPVYEGTLQEALYDLLMKKVAIGISTDGLDNESALTAAGMGTDEALTGLSIGKALWQLIGGLGDEEDRPTRRKAASR